MTIYAAKRVIGWIHELQQEVNTVFSYMCDHPLAVSLTFGDANSTCWTFSLELLRTGLTEAVGQGDVVITPQHSSIMITLSNPEQTMTVSFPRPEVATFLEEIQKLPTLRPETAYDWDQALIQLLNP